MNISYTPIGVIRTPHASVKGMPIQPTGALGVKGTIEIDERYLQGLAGLEGFSHILVLYHLHEIKGYELTVKPYLGDTNQGVFATRAPVRPNPIGISVLALTAVEGGILRVENVDMLDKSPLLDVKPYVPAFDAWEAPRIGWLADVARKAEGHEADERFHSQD